MTQDTLVASEKPQEAAGGDARPEPAPDLSDGRGGPENGSERLAPMDSFREAAIYLRRPFTPEAIKWKVQSNFGEKGCLVVGYIDARLVVERLNLLVPHLWSDDYSKLDANYVRCDLTVDGITRPDVGMGVGKAGYSDALKRAAVKFGIGVSLYAVPRAELWLDQHGKYIQVRKNRKGEPVFSITDAGDAALRLRYARWLEEVGVPKFGEPLDHGDVVGAVGDADVAPDRRVVEASAEEEEPIRELVEGSVADALRVRATGLYEALVDIIGRSEYPPAQFQSGLAAHGDSLATLELFVRELEARLEDARSKVAA